MARAIVSPYTPHVAVAYDKRVANIVPHAKRVTHKGKLALIIPHGIEETLLLRNLGYDLASPILTNYKWAGTTPWEIQRTTAAMLANSRRAFVLSGMGTGKTRAALYAADFLMAHDEASKFLIVAPLSTLSMVWAREIFTVTPHREATILHAGSKAMRVRRLAEDNDYYIINHDGIEVMFDELMARNDIDGVILDESSAYKNAQTKRWKTMRKLLAKKKWVWSMTGTPTPNAPTDAFGQIKLLRPERVPRSFRSFRNKTMIQLTQFKWIAKREANDIVQEAMQPSVRYERSDCVDIPPVTYTTREVPMGTMQAKVYKQLFDTLVVQMKEGKITAVNEGVKMSKLLQIASGAVYTETKGVVRFDDVAKLNELTSVIDEAQRKVLVFAPFKHAVAHIAEALVNKGYDIAVITGSTPTGERNRIFHAFQYTDEIEVIVAHPQTMAHGLTLTAANTVVWYSPAPSLELYLQANARVTRPSQTFKQLIVHLEASAIERKVFKRLQNNEKVQGSLLDMIHAQEVVT